MEKAPQPLAGPRLMLALLACLLVAILEGFDIVAISIAAPALAEAFDLSPSQIGGVFAGGQAGLVIGAVVGGVAGDIMGRRNVLIAGAICFGLFCTLTVYAEGFTSLLAFRSLTGLGIGAVFPNLISLAVETAPAKHRGKAVSLTLAGVPAGGALVAIFASFFMPAYGWKIIFLAGGLLPLVVAPMLLILPKHAAAAHERSLQRAPMTESLFGEGRAATSLLLWLALFLTATVLYMIVNWLPSLMAARGFSVAISHYSSAMFSGGGCLGTLCFGVLVDRLGYRRVLPPAYLGVLMAICGIAFSGASGIILISAGLLGFFVTGSFYTLNGMSPLYYPADARGLGTGAAVGFGRIGSIVGPLAAGYVFQHGFGPVPLGPGAVPAAALPVAVIAGLVAYIVAKRPRVLQQ